MEKIELKEFLRNCAIQKEYKTLEISKNHYIVIEVYYNVSDNIDDDYDYDIPQSSELKPEKFDIYNCKIKISLGNIAECSGVRPFKRRK